MKRTVMLAAALVLALAPAAAAKEVTKAEVCGPDGCAGVDDQEARMALMDGGQSTQPPTAAPFYDVRLTVAEGDQDAHFAFAAVPARHAMRADDGTWMLMTPEVAAVVTRTAGTLRPFPAGKLEGAVAATPTPPPAPAAPSGEDSPLWPEGVIVALIAGAAAFAARALWLRGAARRA